MGNEVRVKEFFDTDFKSFSNLDNVRSIPSLIDGFKDSQRKAVYGMFRHGVSEIKVAQLAGFSALVSHYNHGENSMAGTIVGLAQNYPGSNNINLFEPIGQFGSILSSQSAATRYIYTKPSEWLRKIIKKDDDCILDYRYEDGDKAEPINYFPILPLWLINGSVGIGTGHSTSILPRSPQKVSKLISLLVRGKVLTEEEIDAYLLPEFLGWKGTVQQIGERGKYEMRGVMEVVNTSTLRVTELPVGYGIDKFKSILVDLMDKGIVKDFDNNSTEESFDITIKVPRETSKKSELQLMNLFKLISRTTENITLWGYDNKLKRYEDVFEAVHDFIDFRLRKFAARKSKHIEIYENEIDFLKNKALFIDLWNRHGDWRNVSKDEIISHMISMKVKEEYLDSFMNLRISSLTQEQIDLLQKEVKEKESHLEILNKQEPEYMYKKDLDELA